MDVIGNFHSGLVVKTPVQRARVRYLVQGTRSYVLQLKDPTCCK